VTNITWFSAKAFCLWKGKRLPKELEWEKAASFNILNSVLKKKHKYKWAFGDKFEPDAANTAYYHGLEIGGFWADWWSLFKKDLINKILKGMTTTPVGSFQPGCNNIFDMTGNVWEWCDDVYEGDAYKKIAYVNSMGSEKDPNVADRTATFNYLYEPPHSGKSFDIETQRYRCVRGGSWVDDQEFSRTTNRFKFKPENADNDIGFRCACDLTEEDKKNKKTIEEKTDDDLALQSSKKQ
jgi:formylglycine-generating enzyme required for sulfatase activity